MNKTFRSAEPSWANACVGNNGDPGIADYATGFAQAANQLLDSVIENLGLDLYTDVFIYPICFNMRHAIELFLKSTAADLIKLRAIRKQPHPGFNFEGSHDLGLIWKNVKAQANAFDRRYEDVIHKLDAYIQDVADLDATGQVFRYPYNTDKTKHLTEVGIINIRVLKKQFCEMGHLLHELQCMSEFLLKEYAWGTFTNNLSRHQLYEIAKQLPDRSTWSNESFALARDRVKDAYGLSSRELSTALDLIQKRHEMAHLIGVEVKIPGLTHNLLTNVFDHWFKLHDREDFLLPPEPGIVSSSMPSLDELLMWSVRVRESAMVLSKEINPSDFAIFDALFYFHFEPQVSESFDIILKLKLGEMKRLASDQSEYADVIECLLEKKRFAEQMLKSLYFLGQRELLAFLVSHYGLEKARDRLLT
ncbi:hypothetical protein D5045_12295 [Verminephrobacter eiseniae]|uniref:hypothetical protein n=1 Tax=Verminephrobacter eiseniae TaxID=364317 RepID=UPI002237FA59|nr:hypothetical protein [Verminephrobacter eiseniae]MCW5260935.1 hypothetical protein [Verminephrobacter eiseniae]